MRFTYAVTAVAATAVAAPTWPSINFKELSNPFEAIDHLSSYFNLIAAKVEASKALGMAPVCDTSKAKMPLVDELTPPSAGLTVRHIAVGRGTQNYTCDASKPDDAPKATGAVATLFNVTCMATVYPDVAARMTGMAVHFSLVDADRLGPNVLPVSGHHFFTEKGVPYFDLGEIGQAPTAKNNSAPAPATAASGQKGEPAVPWLKLTTVDGATGNIREVYRVETAGGSAPKTCRGQPNHIEVQYAAQYWFWEGKPE